LAWVEPRIRKVALDSHNIRISFVDGCCQAYSEVLLGIGDRNIVRESRPLIITEATEACLKNQLIGNVSEVTMRQRAVQLRRVCSKE